MFPAAFVYDVQHNSTCKVLKPRAQNQGYSSVMQAGCTLGSAHLRLWINLCSAHLGNLLSHKTVFVGLTFSCVTSYGAETHSVRSCGAYGMVPMESSPGDSIHLNLQFFCPEDFKLRTSGWHMVAITRWKTFMAHMEMKEALVPVCGVGLSVSQSVCLSELTIQRYLFWDVFLFRVFPNDTCVCTAMSI